MTGEDRFNESKCLRTKTMTCSSVNFRPDASSGWGSYMIIAARRTARILSSHALSRRHGLLCISSILRSGLLLRCAYAELSFREPTMWWLQGDICVPMICTPTTTSLTLWTPERPAPTGDTPLRHYHLLLDVGEPSSGHRPCWATLWGRLRYTSDSSIWDIFGSDSRTHTFKCTPSTWVTYPLNAERQQIIFSAPLFRLLPHHIYMI